MSSTIDDRLFLLLKEQAGRPDAPENDGAHFAWKGFWKRMEELTGVTSGRWRNFFSGQQKAAPDMIEGVAKVWPQYAFWLATGITDATNGHVAPTTVLVFPEHLYAEDEHANAYFQHALALTSLLAEQVNIDFEDQERRRSAFERIRVLGAWTAGQVVDAIYSLADSESYSRLLEIWKAREVERPRHVQRITGERRSRVSKDGTKRGLHGATHQDAWDLFYKPRPARDEP